MQWYLNVWKNYVGFQGRARRAEFWMFNLFHLLALLVIYIIDYVIGTFPLLYALYGLASFLPSLAVMVRRLHDTGRSGWWLLISFVPFVGGIILFVFTCLDSHTSQNKWGQTPKQAA